MSPEPMRDWDAFVVSSHLAFVPAVVVALVRFGKGHAWMLMMMSVLAIMIVKMVTMMNYSFSGNSVSGLNSLQMFQNNKAHNMTTFASPGSQGYTYNVSTPENGKFGHPSWDRPHIVLDALKDSVVKKTKVCVLQTDNRPTLNYLLKTQEVNKKFCNILQYDYIFLEINENEYGNINPCTKKIQLVNDLIRNETYDYDILIFLDSDAWIQNWVSLNNVVNRLSNNNQKQGCFSRDPYLKKNTFINSGSFILKINDFTRKMYEYIMKDLYSNGNYHNRWPFDQYYISKYVFDNKDSFVIFVPDILNTPLGKVLRHNWLKNKKMYDDLDKLKNEDTYNNTSSSALRARARARVAGYIGENDYCTKGFPNLSENGYDYFN
jgi:hypothetical protein